MKTTYPISCLLLTITIFLASCTNTPRAKLSKAEQPGLSYDTVSYIFKTIDKYDKDCDTLKGKDCRIVHIKYHIFDGHPVLNDSITAILLAIYPFEQRPLRATTSPEDQAEDFVKQYQKFKKEPYSQGRKYELIATTKLFDESADLLTLQLDAYTYSGGAHGASFTRFINYDVASRKVLSLDDVMNVGYLDSLTKVAERIFKKNEGLDPNKPLKPDAYFFENNIFSLANNYVFTSGGIMFLYNEYEIKPYAAGKTQLLVPYESIRSLLRPASVLQHFLN